MSKGVSGSSKSTFGRVNPHCPLTLPGAKLAKSPKVFLIPQSPQVYPLGLGCTSSSTYHRALKVLKVEAFIKLTVPKVLKLPKVSYMHPQRIPKVPKVYAL